MAKYYDKASPDVEQRIQGIRETWYPELEGVAICALFVFGDEDEQVLTHNGYYAAATMKIVGTKERAAGLADAMLVVDRYVYSAMTPAQMNALLDHELYHLERVIDEKTGHAAIDAIGRPRLSIRKHDRQFGWFDEIAERHGENSIEVQQARHFASATGQLYLDFTRKAEAA
jgi:hypothetical protein